MFTFANPGFLAFGGALVSSPIIIHLINRLRYKRIRWAAMEFLLKSQKKNRRRLIIEQMILLFLRCLLVVLAVLLVARAIEFFGLRLDDIQEKKTVHIVVLHDPMSMADWVPVKDWPNGKETPTCFAVAKDVIESEIAGKAGTGGDQDLVVIVASELWHKQRANEKYEPYRYQKIAGGQVRSTLRDDLKKLQASTLHISLIPSIQKAEEEAKKYQSDQVIVHILSNFRQQDWAGGTSKALVEAVKTLADKTKVNLVDCASPRRSADPKENRDAPQRHDNVGIVEFYPETRVVGSGSYVRFWLALQNYSNTEKQVRVNLFDPESGQQLHDFESGQFIKVPPGPPLLTKVDAKFYRDRDGYSQISAQLEFPGGESDDALTADNVRHSVVMVRTQVPVLIIDSATERQREEDGADTRHLSVALEAAPGSGYAITKAGVDKLNDLKPDDYATVYLLNVGSLDPVQLHNLKNYVHQGGSVAFFLGKEVDPSFYNGKLYARGDEKDPWAGQRLFPVELADHYYPPRDKPEMQPNLDDDHYKVLLRDENFPSKEKFPIFGPIIENPRMLQTFTFLPIRRFFPINDLTKWKPRTGIVDELATMPNLNKVSVYGKKAQEIRGQLAGLAEKYSEYARALQEYRKRINKALERDRQGNEKECYELAQVLDELLHDHPTAGTDKRADMLKFWEIRQNENLKNEITDLYRTVRYGHPLVLASRFGRGRVVTVMTTAGKAWNGWLSLPSYVPMVLEMQSYLTSLGGEANLVLGEALPLKLPANKYLDRIKTTYYLAKIEETKDLGPRTNAKKGGKQGATGNEEAIKAATGGEKGAKKITSDNEVKDPKTGKPVLDPKTRLPRYQNPPPAPLRPGFYVYELTKAKADDSGPKVEEHAFVYNVDTRNESDLLRIPGDMLQESFKGARKDSITLHGPYGWAKKQEKSQSDFSQTAWFYLIFLVILVAEQALAVHLSFHLQEGDTHLPVQAVRSQALA
jgi:hypothetical protein